MGAVDRRAYGRQLKTQDLSTCRVYLARRSTDKVHIVFQSFPQFEGIWHNYSNIVA